MSKTPADALAELEAQIAAAQDQRAAAAKRYAGSGADRDRKALLAAADELSKLERHRDALRLAIAEPSVDAEREQAERAACITDARRKLDQLLERRAGAVEKLSGAFDALAAALSELDIVGQDVSGAVQTLRALTGRQSAPECYPFRADAAALDAVYRTGLGRCGLRMSNRVNVERVVAFGDKVTPLTEAIKLDNVELAERADAMLEPVEPMGPVRTIEDFERERRAARKAHEQRERDAIDAEAREADAKRRERTERRVKLAGVHEPKIAAGAL